jgi:hypothetical protein
MVRWRPLHSRWWPKPASTSDQASHFIDQANWQSSKIVHHTQNGSPENPFPLRASALEEAVRNSNPRIEFALANSKQLEGR